MSGGPGGAAAVIVAAGGGVRLGSSTPKQFLDLGGRPMLAWSVDRFLAHPRIDQVVVVLAPERASDPPEWLEAVRVVAGGATRSDSVRAGVAAVDPAMSVVLVHDGARPFASSDLVTRVVEAARGGPVIPAVPVDDTIKRVTTSGTIVETVEREDLRRAQTPQGFPREALVEAHEAAVEGATDDAMLCEHLGLVVATVSGEATNLKVTTSADLAWARWALESGLIPKGD